MAGEYAGPDYALRGSTVDKIPNLTITNDITTFNGKSFGSFEQLKEMVRGSTGIFEFGIPYKGAASAESGLIISRTVRFNGKVVNTLPELQTLLRTSNMEIVDSRIRYTTSKTPA